MHAGIVQGEGEPDQPDPLRAELITDGEVDRRTHIMMTMQSNHDALKRCYEVELKANPSLSGEMKVRFTIQPEGHVSEAFVTENTLGLTSMTHCVLSTMYQLHFRPNDKEEVVAYPFTFKPSK